MKVSPELNVTLADPIQANEFDLPQGLIGFPDFHRAELLFDAAQLPYLWMKVSGPDGAVNFVVIEPGGIIAGYELEIFDNDAEALGIVDPGETMVLNIVTVQRQNPLHATVNLAGPIVVNLQHPPRPGRVRGDREPFGLSRTRHARPNPKGQ